MVTLTKQRQRPMGLGAEPNDIGHCLGLCAVCTVLHITIESNSIGLDLGFGLGLC